jgi:tetratricopeptide (TPR) repeat protein
MRSSRIVLSLTAVAMAVAFLCVAPGDATAQASDRSILVAPLVVGEGLPENFGKDVAKRVREALEGFGAYVAIEEGDVKDFLGQYDLKAENLSPIEWRQMAGQMSAALVMVGTATPVGSGIEIDVSFFDPRTQDQLPVAPFTIVDRKQDREAAAQIIDGLSEQVEYLQSILFCSEYLSSEQVDDAIRNCDRALEMNPNSDRARYLRGRTHMLSDSWGAAAEDLQAAVVADPSNIEALQSLAYVYAQLGDAENSLKYYREYLNFNPNDAAVRLRIAYDLANAGGFAEAMSILDDGVALDPENIDLLEYLGNVALSAGQSGGQVTDEAAIRKSVDAFEKVLAAKGSDVAPTMLTNVVNAYSMVGDYAAALRFSDRAIELINNPAPASADGGDEAAPTASKEEMLAQVYSARANVFSATEDYGAAAAALEMALQNNPELPNGHQRVALYKLRSGDSDGAIASFRVAVQSGANGDEIANALFGQGYNDHFEKNEFLPAIALFDVAAEFAQAPDMVQQIQFFTAYGYYKRGTAFDEGNADAEACGPARAALEAFRNVGPHLGRSGSYQANSQAQIREAVDVQLYRQEQIVEKSCQR